MNIVTIAQITGVITIFLLFCLKFYIAVSPKSSTKLLRVAILWTSIYIFFLFIIRAISLSGIATLDQLRVISGFASVIPFLAVLAQLWLDSRIEKDKIELEKRLRRRE